MASKAQAVQVKRKRSKQVDLATSTWDAAKYDAFGAELDAIKAEVQSQLGKKDLAYIKKVEDVARTCEWVGRLLLHFSLDPFTWSAGVMTLAVHHQLHATEIGHSALHGAWDGLAGAEHLYSNQHNWKSPVDEASWKHEHNILHHQYTNVIGRDPDLNYGLMRASEKVNWMPYHLIQVAQFFWTAPVFLWVIGTYVTGLNDVIHGERGEDFAKVLPNRKLKTVAGALQKTLRKAVPYSLYNFALWPALAGPGWLKVLAGNLSADVLRNVYSAATIYAGHFGEDLEYYDQDFRAQGRGQWYKAQAEAAHNYEVPLPMSILCGGLDTQIEHHLFPKLPPNRLREIKGQVQEICERYGVGYQRSTWGKTLGGAIKHLASLSLPKSLKSTAVATA